MSENLSSEDEPSENSMTEHDVEDESREIIGQCRKFHFVTGLTTGMFGAILIRGLWVSDVFSVLIGLFAVAFPIWATRKQATEYREGDWT